MQRAVCSFIWMMRIRRKAADMHKSAVELTDELLRAVIRGDIYEAVLDDDG